MEYTDISNFESYHKILHIEDNLGDARLVELLLLESDLLNCKIINKATLAEGLKELERNGDYAAILLDLTLQDSQGFETLERLLERFPDKNVIILTGLSDKRLGLKAVKAGAQDFLIKGAFDADLLAKTLRYSIERSSVLLRLEETQRITKLGSWEYSPDTKEFRASNEVFRILGNSVRKNITSLDELKNEDSTFLIFEEIHKDTFEFGEIKKDLLIELSGGESRYVFIQCQTNTNTESRLVLSGVLHDISERKQMELELLRSQERYQEVFTKSKDAIFIINLQGTVIDFNNATCKLLGYNYEELTEFKIFNTIIPSKEKENFLNLVQARKNAKDFEITIRAKNKDFKICLLSIDFVKHGDADEIYNIIATDITLLKRKERFTVGILELKELMELQTAFIQYWNFFTDYVKSTKGENVNFNIKKHPKGLEWEVELSSEISSNKIKSYLDEYLSYVLDKSISIEDNITKDSVLRREIEFLKLKHQLQLNHLEQQVLIYQKENKFLQEDKDYFKGIIKNMLESTNKAIEKANTSSFRLKGFISKNQFSIVFDQLIKSTNNEAQINEVVICKSKLTKLELEQRKGTINKEYYSLELNKIRDSLLKLIDEIVESSTSIKID